MPFNVFTNIPIIGIERKCFLVVVTRTATEIMVMIVIGVDVDVDVDVAEKIHEFSLREFSLP
jgi:hypothetical protein